VTVSDDFTEGSKIVVLDAAPKLQTGFAILANLFSASLLHFQEIRV
jgi:hypothetical protein